MNIPNTMTSLYLYGIAPSFDRLNLVYPSVLQCISSTCDFGETSLATPSYWNSSDSFYWGRNVQDNPKTLEIEVPGVSGFPEFPVGHLEASVLPKPPADKISQNEIKKFDSFYRKENMNQRILRESSSLGTETQLWRPYLSPELKVPTERQGGHKQNKVEIYKSIPRIIPSQVKIEASKTSVFKPIQKKSYRCSVCSSVYSNSAQLVSHLRGHTGSKPFGCEFPNCSKIFARNEELTRHRRIHSGYKPHICNSCGKTFGRKDHLSKHLKTHLHVSEKKVYGCSVLGCGHRYTRSDALTRHMSTAHPHEKDVRTKCRKK